MNLRTTSVLNSKNKLLDFVDSASTFCYNYIAMSENLTLINTENIPTQTSGPWTKLAVAAVSSCPKIKKEREKEILFDRFGVGKNSRTLQAIGQKYGVTRERIRQIVNNSIKKIQKNCPNDELILKIEKIEKIVLDSGGIITKDDLNKSLEIDDKTEQNSIKFVATLSKNIEFLKESNVFKQSWIKRGIKQSKIKNIAKSAVDFLKEKGKIAQTAVISKAIGEDEGITDAVLSCVKSIMKTDNGKWGLISWPHVNPKSIRDKSKYIMVRHGKPLHYADLTIKIGDMGAKNVTKQSVHNELIKNKDFVLVGRGIYALTDWGYVPGVVEEVIYSILIDAGEPLHKDEIVKRVLEKRIVKVSTVVLNLQKSRFRKVSKAVYTIN